MSRGRHCSQRTETDQESGVGVLLVAVLGTLQDARNLLPLSGSGSAVLSRVDEPTTRGMGEASFPTRLAENDSTTKLTAHRHLAKGGDNKAGCPHYNR
jgi:hypothetical protein